MQYIDVDRFVMLRSICQKVLPFIQIAPDDTRRPDRWFELKKEVSNSKYLYMMSV